VAQRLAQPALSGSGQRTERRVLSLINPGKDRQLSSVVLVTNYHRRIAGSFPIFSGENSVKTRWEVGLWGYFPVGTTDGH